MMNKKAGCVSMTEGAIRKRLARRGCRLVTLRDAYGDKGYLIANQDNVIVFGNDEYDRLTLEEVSEYIE